jgi:mannose-6-phosphate isomerase-like protein (cupin superfamily)
MTQAQTLTPLAVGSDEGEAIWWFGSLAVIKASAAATGGATSLIEITAPPNLEGPLHVHHREEEGFYILEGSATFQIGDQTVEAKAGDYLLGPRDIPHKFGSRGLPDALHHDPRRVRGSGPGDGRACGEPDPPTSL